MFFQLQKFSEFDGIATGVMCCQEPDFDNEIMDYFGSKPYIQNWSSTQLQNSQGKSKGNVRLQHDAKKLAGFLTDIDFDDRNKRVTISAKILDPTARTMLQQGVLTGFSIGGSYIKKTPLSNGLTQYIANPSEVSVVDRPCSPSAVFESVKADGTIQLVKFQKTWDGLEKSARILSLLQAGFTDSETCVLTGSTAGELWKARKESRAPIRAARIEKRRKMVEERLYQ